MNDFTYQFIPGTGDRTLLLLHGTGGNENDLLPLGRAIDPDASLLSPRGKVLENGARDFFGGWLRVFSMKKMLSRGHTNSQILFPLRPKSMVSIRTRWSRSAIPTGKYRLGDDTARCI